MKITAAPQVFDCLLEVGKSNLYLSDVSKNLCANCTAAPQLVKQTERATLLYDAYYVGYAWRAIFEIIHLVVLSDRSQKCAAKGLRCLAASA